MYGHSEKVCNNKKWAKTDNTHIHNNDSKTGQENSKGLSWLSESNDRNMNNEPDSVVKVQNSDIKHVQSIMYLIYEFR